MASLCNRLIFGLIISSFVFGFCVRAQEANAPKSAGEWNMVGMGMALQDRWPEAAQAFQQAAQLRPSFMAAHNNLGFVFATMGRQGDAIKAFQQAIKSKPDESIAYYNLGFTYETMGKWREAADAFEQTLKHAPRWDLPAYHLGYCDLQLSLWKEAAEAFQRYMNPPTTRSSADEAGQKGSQSDDPIQEGVLTFNVEPEKYIAFANLAYAYQKQQKYSDAVAAYRKSLDLQSDFADGHYSLAETYLLSGNRQGALNELEVLQKLNADLAAKLRALIDNK